MVYPAYGSTTHSPIRPTWKCAGCSEAWPCLTRREQLVPEFLNNPTSMIMLMGAYFIDACEDLPDAPAGVLHAQFIGWARTAVRGMYVNGVRNGHGPSSGMVYTSTARAPLPGGEDYPEQSLY